MEMERFLQEPMLFKFFKYVYLIVLVFGAFLTINPACKAESVGFIAELSPDFNLVNWAIYRLEIYSGSKMKNGNFLVSVPEHFLEFEPMPSCKIVNAYLAKNPISASEFSDGSLFLVDARKAARYTKSGRTITLYNEKNKTPNYGIVLPDDNILLGYYNKLLLKTINNITISKIVKPCTYLSDIYNGNVMVTTINPNGFFEIAYDGNLLKNNYIHRDGIATITKLKNNTYVVVHDDYKNVYILNSEFKVLKTISSQKNIRGASVLKNGNFLIYGECLIEKNLLKIFKGKPYILDKKIDLRFLYD